MPLRSFFLVLPSLFLLFFSGCDNRRDIRDYYFPVRELINVNGQVYAYENIGTLPAPEREYWYYLGVDQDTALHLSITRYGPDFTPEQQSREEICNDGVRLRELAMLPADSNGIAQPVAAEVLYAYAFPFYLRDNDPTAYGYRLRLSSPEVAGATNYVTLDRRYRGDTTFLFQGETYDAIIFDLEGEVSLRDSVEGDISPTFQGYEIYAKGLGRVAYWRELAKGASMGGRLVERLPMEEFIGRVRRMQ